MKKISTIALLFISVCIIFSCKKDEEKEDLEQIQQAKIVDIIPAKYIDSLNLLGMKVHEGTTPPNVTGIFRLTPMSLISSNISTDVIGTTYAETKLHLFSQDNSSFDIKMYGKNFVSYNDTSIVTVVSGNGNKFSVYGKVKATIDGNSAIFGIILSGEFAGGTITKAEYGIINIDNSNGGTSFIKEGKARVVRETDQISEILDSF